MSTTRPFRLSRRHFLRGSLASGTGVLLGVPILDVMLNNHGTAFADGSSVPMRFGTFFWGCGIVQRAWTPTSTGTGWQLPTPGNGVPASLAPFTTSVLKPYTTVVTGFNHNYPSPGHIPARQIALTNTHEMTLGIPGAGTYRGQNAPEASIDTIVASAWKGTATYDQLGVRVVDAGPYRGNSSWQPGGALNSFELSPTSFYNRLFSVPVTPPTDQTNVYKKSMLDAVAADAKALQSKLGANDKQRLSQHLDSIRSIEAQLTAPAITGCATPTNPMGDPDARLARAQLFADQLAVALSCGMTRVFSFEFSAVQSETAYPEIGFQPIIVSGSPFGHHELTHEDSTGDTLVKITNYIMTAYAYLADRFRQTPDAAGTNLLDNTLVLGTSPHANAGNHDMIDHPLLMVGKAQGKIKAGIHFRHANPGNNWDAPNVLLTAVRAAGVNLPSLGRTAGLTTAATDSVTGIVGS